MNLIHEEVEKATEERPRIVGLSTENSEINEGVINCNIIFTYA